MFDFRQKKINHHDEWLPLKISKGCFFYPSPIIAWPCHFLLGTGDAPKTDEFFGKVSNGLWPPPHFRKIMLHFFIIFTLKPCFKVQNLQHKFLDWKWAPPPPWTFSKIHPFWLRHPSLREGWGGQRFENQGFAKKIVTIVDFLLQNMHKKISKWYETCKM